MDNPEILLLHTLFNYSIDREDMKVVLNILPEYFDNKRDILEYELQILKIISTSWAISFFLFDRPEKSFLLKTFWEKIRGFAIELSSTLKLTCEKDINYFDILKSRTSIYVNSMI